jgi:hypothetical protein
MGDLEDLQTLLGKVDAAVPILIAGGTFSVKYAKLKQGNMIYNNQNNRRKIDEYSLFIHFKDVSAFGTYETALFALLENFNNGIAIAGYSYVAGFLNAHIARTIVDTPQGSDYNGINKTYIINVTRIY